MRKSFTAAFARHDVTLATWCVVLSSLLLLAPHWGMFYSNSDDPWIARATWDEINRAASDQGRFWLIPIMVLAGLPFKLGGLSLVSMTKILVNGFVLFTFTKFLSRLVNLRYALATTVTWLALLDVSHGYYSAFHGFHMMFNLQMGALFLSLWWYLVQIDAGKKGLQFAGPYLLFGFAILAYESMLFNAGAYLAVALHRWQDSVPESSPSASSLRQLSGFVTWSLSWARSNWVLFVVIAAYVGAYYGYRSFQPTPGRGLDFGGETGDIIKTIYRFSIYGFHVGFKPAVEGAISPLTLVSAILFALCLVLAAAIVLPKADVDPREARLRTPTGIALIVFFIFCPNILHGFVEGYRQWASESPYYVGNYLSSFALAVIATNGIVAVAGGVKARQEPLLFLFVLYVLASSAMDNMSKWSALAETNRRDAGLWTRAIQDLKQLAWAGPPETLRLCGKDAPEKVSGDDKFWSYQLSRELGQKIEFRSKRINSSPCDHTIDFNRYRAVSP